MGTFPVPRTSSRNVEREHHGTSFPNMVERESYAEAIIETSVQVTMELRGVCAYCAMPVRERPAAATGKKYSW
jgi:hypothetical protein